MSDDWVVLLKLLQAKIDFGYCESIMLFKNLRQHSLKVVMF